MTCHSNVKNKPLAAPWPSDIAVNTVMITGAIVGECEKTQDGFIQGIAYDRFNVVGTDFDFILRSNGGVYVQVIAENKFLNDIVRVKPKEFITVHGKVSNKAGDLVIVMYKCVVHRKNGDKEIDV